MQVGLMKQSNNNNKFNYVINRLKKVIDNIICNRCCLCISFSLALMPICLSSTAIEINKRTVSALEYVNKGYIQYGYEELKKNAAVNDLAAQYYLAVCYEHGIGIEKDMTQAFMFYRKAAERGLPDAMYHIALFYRDGIVVSKDASREREWQQRYNQKGGNITLPDLIQLYNEGLKHPENYALNPNGDNNNQSRFLANGNVNQQNQTINNITIVQQAQEQPDNSSSQGNKQSIAEKSDVDLDIPITLEKQGNTFVLIIANENYHDVAMVPNAINDGTVFSEYCEKTLGIPQSNIKFTADATLNNIRREMTWLVQVMEAYNGEANIIFYYAGHGIPNESNGSAYLLPVDGVGNDVSTGYSLDKLYADLISKPARSVVVLLDACFSGAKRDGGMLASARGVAIKVKQNAPKGNMVVLSAAQGDETAYPYKEKGHGLFTYYLLKKLQETKGDITFGELADYVTAEVKKQSIVVNGKMQTPLVSPSSSATDWRNWKLR